MLQSNVDERKIRLRASALLAVGMFAILTISLGVYSSLTDSANLLEIGYNYEAPTFIFLTLTVFDVLQYAFPPAGRRPRDPELAALVLHIIPFVSYLLRHLHLTPVLVIDVAGEQQHVVPIRYIEWLCTTPFIQLLLGSLGGSPAGMVERVAAYNCVTILTGGIARLLNTRGLSFALAAVSCLFGVLTSWGMALLIAQVHSIAAADSNTKMRVRSVGVFLVLAYTVYPVVFFLHYSGGISTVLREQIYAGLDVSAKCAATSVLLGGFFNLHIMELTAAKAVLRSSNEAKAAFTAFILQQTKAPLTRAARLLATVQGVDKKAAAHHSEKNLQALELTADIVARLHESLDDMIVYRSLAIDSVSCVPAAVSIKETCSRLLTNTTQMCKQSSLSFDGFVQPNLPDTCVFDQQRWLQVVDALVRRSCSATTPGGHLSFSLTLEVRGFALGALQVCILDTSSVSQEDIDHWADAAGFFETFLKEDAVLSNVAQLTDAAAATNASRSSIASLLDSTTDMSEEREASHAKASANALRMALAERLAKLQEGSLEVEQLPSTAGSRAKRVSEHLSSSGWKIPAALMSQLTGSGVGVFSCVTIPVAIPPEADVAIPVASLDQVRDRLVAAMDE